MGNVYERLGYEISLMLAWSHWIEPGIGEQSSCSFGDDIDSNNIYD